MIFKILFAFQFFSFDVFFSFLHESHFQFFFHDFIYLFIKLNKFTFFIW
jgi:hypothetical protein